jgi:hypothetical protein
MTHYTCRQPDYVKSASSSTIIAAMSIYIVRFHFVRDTAQIIYGDIPNHNL